MERGQEAHQGRSCRRLRQLQRRVYPPLQAADILAYEGGKFLKNPTGTPRRAFTALDPDKTRIIARRYGKDNMPEFIRLLTDFRAKLLAQGWDGKVA